MSHHQHGQLPIPDFDELSTGTLQHRIRSLSGEDLETLLRHERGHAGRPAVIQLLSARIGQLDEGAQPSPGGNGSPFDRPQRSQKRSRISPKTSAQPISPPPHGTPDQPGKPKGNRP